MTERGTPPSVSESELRELLQREENLAIAMQPVVDLKRGEIVGYEALARFRLSTPLSPDRVFAAADRAGLGPELEATVVRRVLALAEHTPNNCFLALNIDPRHLTAPLVQEALSVRDNLESLVFELTEHYQIEDWSGVGTALADLRRRGGLIAVDDAGSGYSGLKQILELRPQILKVDRELVTQVHRDEAKRALIQMLGEFAGRLDAWLLAEGIETALELQTLCQLKVPLGQGYFLARPAPPWTDLSTPASDAFADFPRSIRDRDTVGPLVELCVLCAADEAWPEAEQLSVRISQERRPQAMRLKDAFGEHLRASHELLWVKKESLLSAVARRAATRPEALRWDPILCVNEQGKLEGVIHLQRVLGALADAIDATRARLH